jgi:hypothetical protein
LCRLARIIRAMHLMIPFAAPLSEAGRQAAAALALPKLQALLRHLQVQDVDTGDEWSLSPPHERALARALGLQGADGLLPWAARQAQADGVPAAPLDDAGCGWAWLTPAHWHLGTDQVSLMDPQHLMLDDSSSRLFCTAVEPLFSSEGFALHYGAPLRWYLAHPSLASLAAASLDRVIGRNVDRFLSNEGTAGRLRRLQSEAQMLLYTHPANDQRQAQGLLPVNSFWLSGCGAPQRPSAAPDTAAPQVDARLRAPALAEDWAAWVKAWDTLDEGPLAALNAAVVAGKPVQLTLCGERSALTLASAPRSLWRRLQHTFAPPPLWPLLEPL